VSEIISCDKMYVIMKNPSKKVLLYLEDEVAKSR